MEEGLRARSTRSASSTGSERQYEVWGSIGNLAKSIDRKLKTDSLGYSTDGWEVRQDPPEGYLRDLVLLTLWLCLQSCVTRR